VKEQHNTAGEDEETTPGESHQSAENGMTGPFDQRADQVPDASLGLGQAPIPQHTTLQIVQPSPVSGIQVNALNRTRGNCMCSIVTPFLVAMLNVLQSLEKQRKIGLGQ